VKHLLWHLCWLGVLAPWAPAQPPTEKEELDRFQGIWNCVGGNVAGKKIDDKEAAKLGWSFNIQGNRLTKTINGKTVESFALKLFTYRNPKEVDLEQLDGRDRGEKSRGIYAMDDEILRLCLRTKINGRPRTFDVPEGVDDVYLVLKKFVPKVTVYRRSLVTRMTGFTVSPAVAAAVVEAEKK
jgi:uncharacterized protein (TIGR03067 family)